MDEKEFASVVKTDERKLIEQLKSDSITAYKQLYELWVSRLYYFVFQYVKSEPVTDDIVQETFLRIWNNRSKLNPESSFKAYLFTVSYRLLLKELRRHLNNPLMGKYLEYQENLVVSGEYIEESIDIEQFQKVLMSVKRKLSPRQREIFELNKEREIPVADIAAKFSISEQVVRNQLSASLKIIRSELKNHTFLLSIFLLSF